MESRPGILRSDVRRFIGGAEMTGAIRALSLAVLALTALASTWISAAVACDPPYIVDEETGEVDEAAWDAGVEECARWVEEMEGVPSAADLAAQIITGLVAVGLSLWLRPKRAEPDVGDPRWTPSSLLSRAWWVFAALGGWLVLVAVARAL
jgi:hypothetical protein